MSLHFDTIAEAGARLRAGEVTSRALTELMLERIETHNPALNAFVTVTADLALEQADAADAGLAVGSDLGPLHGIPVAIKDLIDTEGILTTCGSKLFADNVPGRDATVVRRLRDAGAVMLGKTGLHELAYGTTSINAFYGPIANPWAPDHHPGGSSGGSAVAVAAGLAYAAIGTDTGCSIRQPAHCCGITGLKPTFGLVSKAGVHPMVWTMDHVGPLTRDVADAATVLAVIAGEDPDDPYGARGAPPFSYTPGDSDLEGVRIGVMRTFFFEDGDPEVIAVVERAMSTFETLGARLVDVELAGINAAFSSAGRMFADVSATYRDALETQPGVFSEELQRKLGSGLDALAIDLARAHHTRVGFRAEMDRVMAACDVLLAPTSTVTAAPITELPEGHGLQCWRNAGIFNFTGQPSISVPCGFTEAGLPVGAMLSGRLFEDAAVLRIAHAYEAATDWHLRRPPLFAQ